jgi:carboxypeptidase Q
MSIFKKIPPGLLLGAVIASGAHAASAPSTLPLDLGRSVQRDSRAYALVTELTSRIGPRMSATEKGSEAENFVYEKLRQFGLRDVRYEPFRMTSWKRGSIEVTVDGHSIPAAAMVYTPAHAELSAEIVEVGNGTSADYAEDYDKVRDRIALIYMGTLPESPPDTPHLPRWEKLALAIGHGARGVIFINPAAGNHLTTGIAGGSANLVPIPAAAVGHEDGLRLRKELQERGTLGATMRLDNTVGVGTARNVIATLPGTRKPGQVIVVGAHLDSLDLGTGAVDNGSGAMWVLDVARAFAVHHVHPERTIQFTFFMGEEEGLLGSYTRVRRAVRAGTLNQVWYMINTDMSVSPKGMRLWGGSPDLEFFRSLAAQVREIYPSFTDVSDEQASMSQSSDSQPYIEQGVPIIYPLGDWPEGLMACTHAECDDMHWLDDAQMRRSAVIGAMLIAALTQAPDSIVHGFTPAETHRYYQDAHITVGYRGPARTD